MDKEDPNEMMRPIIDFIFPEENELKKHLLDNLVTDYIKWDWKVRITKTWVYKLLLYFNILENLSLIDEAVKIHRKLYDNSIYSILNNLRKLIIKKHGSLTNKIIDEILSDNFIQEVNKDYYRDIYNLIIRDDYLPPSNVELLFEHGFTLIYYYLIEMRHFGTNDKLTDNYFILDMSFLKILVAAQSILSRKIFKTNRYSKGTGKSAQTRGKKADIKRKYVIEILEENLTISPDMSLSAIAAEIERIYRERWRSGKISKEFNPPGVEQIKRYLDVGGVWDNFKKGKSTVS